MPPCTIVGGVSAGVIRRLTDEEAGAVVENEAAGETEMTEGPEGRERHDGEKGEGAAPRP